MDSISNDENIKIITITEPKKKASPRNKPQSRDHNSHEKSKRAITQTKIWNFTPQELLYSFQKTLLENIDIHDPQTQFKEYSHILSFIKKEIQKKIYGYKCQDLKKEMFSPSDFVKMENIIQKLKDCNLTCYYCKEPIYILYEFVREPHQWTLERINNAEGHINTNTEIACLKCNLSRRCIFHERYLFTKQISNIVKENIDNTP